MKGASTYGYEIKADLMGCVFGQVGERGFPAILCITQLVNAGIEPDVLVYLFVDGVTTQVGLYLVAGRPLGIFGRHREIGECIFIAGSLCGDADIRPALFPYAAEVGRFFEYSYFISFFDKCFGSGESADALPR